ncbi:MAG: hypothetical protein WKF79_10135 [Nocardioides sp.]
MRPTQRRLVVTVAGLACSLALLAGCGGDEPEAETLPSDGPSSTTTSPTAPEPTETTTASATPEDEAANEAEQTVRDYYAFTDELVADDSIDLDRLDTFLQDPELTDRRTFFERFRDQGLSSEGGSTTFEWVKPTAVKLYPKRGEAAVSLRVCLNLDDVQVMKGGEPVDLLSPALATLEVYNYDYPNSTNWKIAVENAPGKRCRK